MPASSHNIGQRAWHSFSCNTKSVVVCDTSTPAPSASVRLQVCTTSYDDHIQQCQCLAWRKDTSDSAARQQTLSHGTARYLGCYTTGWEHTAPRSSILRSGNAPSTSNTTLSSQDNLSEAVYTKSDGIHPNGGVPGILLDSASARKAGGSHAEGCPNNTTRGNVHRGADFARASSSPPHDLQHALESSTPISNTLHDTPHR